MSEPKLTRVTLTLVLNEADCLRLLDNSIERVLSNAARVGEAAAKAKSEALSEAGSVLWQDADELRPLTTRIWNAARDAVLRIRLASQPDSPTERS